MSAKKLIILITSILAFVAVVVGLCLFFCGNKVINSVPSFVSVQKIDNEFFLTTEFSQGNQYQFKIEQYIDDQPQLINIVKSDKNQIKLSDQKLDLNVGSKFLFSVCYATENGSGNGKYCEPVSWSPRKQLESVDYASVQFDLQENKITWDAVADAEYYWLYFFDGDGRMISNSKTTGETLGTDFNEFLLVDANNQGKYKIDAGKFKLFIVADSSDDDILPSNFGAGQEGLEISLKNEVLDASGSEETFSVTCSQRVETFQVSVDGLTVLIQDFEEPAQIAGNYVYDLSNIFNVFKSLDFSKSRVEIKTLTNGLVLESEVFVVDLI